MWDLGSSSLSRAPSLTPDSEGKRPAQAVRKEPKEPKKVQPVSQRWGKRCREAQYLTPSRRGGANAGRGLNTDTAVLRF